MTPAEWAELDRLEREFTTELMVDPEFGTAREDDLREALSWRLRNHARELIDAARPKCQACAGKGWNIFEVPCSDCDGTGLAK